MKFFNLAAAGATSLALLAAPVQAATVDVDIMFVIDQTGSMDDELLTLSNSIATFVNGLSGTPDVSSVGVGLVTYEEARNGPGNAGCSSDPNEPCLRLWNPISTSSDLTALQTSLGTAAANTFGSLEDALSAVSSVLPDGDLFTAAGWRNNTVKSVVLITDEDADDRGLFTYDGLTGYAALGKQLDDVNYLNNVITETFLFNDFRPISRPLGPNPGDNTALFDINDFTGAGADPALFLAQFAAAKLNEITTTGVNTGGSTPNPNVVPLPAAGWMLIAGVGSLMAMRRRTS